MKGRIFWRVLMGVVLVAVLVGVGMWAYNMGVAQGLAGNTGAVAPFVGGRGIMPHGGWSMHPMGFGFSPLHLLGGIFLFFLLLAGLRALFFGGMMHRHGGWGGHRGPWNGEVPPMVEEMHRKMHEKQDKQQEPPAEQK